MLDLNALLLGIERKVDTAKRDRDDDSNGDLLMIWGGDLRISLAVT